MSYLPSTIKTQLLSRIKELDNKVGLLKDNSPEHKRQQYILIFESVERGLRECFAREIFAYHDTECVDTIICNCTDLANLIAGDIAGDELGI